jgi:hypothetical protein
MALEHVGRDIYLRHTDKNGKSYVQQHRVWDAGRFVAAQLAAAVNEGGKAFVQQITEDQYRKERQARK